MCARCAVLATFGLLVLATGTRAAQPGLLQPGTGLDGIDLLLQDETVQQELKLSEEQLQKIKEVTREIRQRDRPELDKLKELGAEERKEKVKELMQKNSQEILKEVSAFLRPEQIKRLKQIQVQQAGLHAFSDPKIVKALKLTAGQQNSIKLIGEDARQKAAESFRSGQPRGNFQEALKKLAELRRDAVEKVLGVLTPNQRKVWKELAGEPLELKLDRAGIRSAPEQEKKSAPSDKP